MVTNMKNTIGTVSYPANNFSNTRFKLKKLIGLVHIEHLRCHMEGLCASQLYLYQKVKDADAPHECAHLRAAAAKLFLKSFNDIADAWCKNALNVITVRKRSLQRLRFYTCHSVHRGGGVCRSACWDTPHPPRGPPGADTPTTRSRYPQEHTPPGADNPPGADTPPPRNRRLLLRTVRILLECILF